MKNLIASALVILAFAALSLSPSTASAWPKGGKKGASTCNCGKAPKEPKEHKARGRHKASADGDAQPID